MLRLVLDTDVVIAALRSPRGASAEILRLAIAGRVRLLLSVPLALEYEAVLTRKDHLDATGLSRMRALAVIDDIVAVSEEVHCHYRWRPQLRDAADEMVLETAINGHAESVVSFNRRDFGDAPARFGVRLCTPSDFLRSLST